MITTLYGDCRDVLTTLPAQSVHLCITSPPYFGLRAYSDDPREIGREPTPDAYIANMVAVFAAVRRVLRDDGVLVVNLGDSFARNGGESGGTMRELAHLDGTQRRMLKTPDGYKEKDKLLIPHRVALALQADGWYLRQDMPWLKRNAMPESVTDRPTTAHEYLFLLSKAPRYWWDAEAIRVQAEQRNYPTWEQRKADGAPMRRGDPGQSGDVTRWAGLGVGEGGRNYRTTDPWFTSLDIAIDEARAHLAALERLRERGGVLEDGDPLALQVNPTPYAGAHFAVYPPALVEPFVKAGCPRQACPHCGAGWVRVVERETNWKERRAAGAWAGNVGVSDNYQNGVHGKGMSHDLGATTKRRDLGFRPGCTCPEHEPVPGVVLDPFFGSGTTGRVAVAQGRRCIGIDLNADYAPLQAQRTDGVQITLGLEDAA